MENQVKNRLEEALKEFTTVIQTDMDLKIATAIAEMHNHTNSNDLTDIKAKMTNNMETVTTHLTANDEAIELSQIMWNY